MIDNKDINDKAVRFHKFLYNAPLRGREMPKAKILLFTSRVRTLYAICLKVNGTHTYMRMGGLIRCKHCLHTVGIA